MRPVICMITDGRLTAAHGAALIGRVAAAARAGVDLIQIRERNVDDRVLLAVARDCVDVARGTSARVIVNDRLDVALAAGAHGVHLRTDSIPASRVRRVAPSGFLIGRSVHSVREARECGADADYLIFGPVFATASKPGQQPAGVAALADAAAATTAPVLAIGGITVDTAANLAATGAAGIAAIGLFMNTRFEALLPLRESIVRAFDAHGGVS